jgi:hypothetical protein
MWNKNLFQKINCESYQESHTKRQLFWAPPSYIWYGDPTPLNQKTIHWYYKNAKENWTIHDSIKHIPNFSIILFDEFEKAHKDIAQSLLSLLDEWEVNFWDWKTWNFKNSIIIFTSNIWQKEIEESKEKNQIWFISEQFNKDDISKIMDKSLKNKFSPEFRWRITKFVDFELLTKEDAKKIIKIQLKKLNKHYKKYYKNMNLSISLWTNIFDKILEEWFNNKSWARALISCFENYVENNLINLFNSDEFKKFYYLKTPITIFLDINNNEPIYKVFLKDKKNTENKSNVNSLVVNNEKVKIDLDKIRFFNETIQEYIATYNLHINDSDVDFSDDLILMEKMLFDLWFSMWDIKYLKNCSMIELLSEITTLWRYDFIEENKNVFFPITQRIVYKYVEKKVMKYVGDYSIQDLKPYDIVEQIWYYLSKNFFDWNVLNSKQIFEILYFIWKVYIEKYNIEIKFQEWPEYDY